MAYTNIDDPSAHFQAKGYAGNSVDNTAITNDGNSDLQPDLIWFARYDTPADKFLLNSSTGVTKFLISSGTSAEGTSTSLLKSFDTNGFSVGTNSNTNSSSSNYVAWQWKANGGTTSSNTDGSVTSTVQVNQDAGFSIVTYTVGIAGGNHSVGHGLGVAPDFIVIKCRGTAQDWLVYHSSLGSGNYIKLNTTAGSVAYADSFGDGVTSSVFGYNYAGTTIANQPYIAYCFAEKQGYSKFGSYVGNGNDNGPFIYTGFKPAFVLTKGTNASQWRLYDSARSPNNVNINRLFPYTNSAEATDTDAGIDMLSNGFKIRGSGGDYNASGTTYIYMAFADNPLVTSTGIPTTAR